MNGSLSKCIMLFIISFVLCNASRRQFSFFNPEHNESEKVVYASLQNENDKHIETIQHASDFLNALSQNSFLGKSFYTKHGSINAYINKLMKINAKLVFLNFLNSSTRKRLKPLKRLRNIIQKFEVISRRYFETVLNNYYKQLNIQIRHKNLKQMKNYIKVMNDNWRTMKYRILNCYTFLVSVLKKSLRKKSKNVNKPINKKHRDDEEREIYLKFNSEDELSNIFNTMNNLQKSNKELKTSSFAIPEELGTYFKTKRKKRNVEMNLDPFRFSNQWIILKGDLKSIYNKVISGMQTDSNVEKDIDSLLVDGSKLARDLEAMNSFLQEQDEENKKEFEALTEQTEEEEEVIEKLVNETEERLENVMERPINITVKPPLDPLVLEGIDRTMEELETKQKTLSEIMSSDSLKRIHRFLHAKARPEHQLRRIDRLESKLPTLSSTMESLVMNNDKEVINYFKGENKISAILRHLTGPAWLQDEPQAKVTLETQPLTEDTRDEKDDDEEENSQEVKRGDFEEINEKLQKIMNSIGTFRTQGHINDQDALSEEDETETETETEAEPKSETSKTEDESENNSKQTKYVQRKRRDLLSILKTRALDNKNMQIISSNKAVHRVKRANDIDNHLSRTVFAAYQYDKDPEPPKEGDGAQPFLAKDDDFDDVLSSEQQKTRDLVSEANTLLTRIKDHSNAVQTKWEKQYDEYLNNNVSVPDPMGNTSADPGDYTIPLAKFAQLVQSKPDITPEMAQSLINKEIQKTISDFNNEIQMEGDAKVSVIEKELKKAKKEKETQEMKAKKTIDFLQNALNTLAKTFKQLNKQTRNEVDSKVDDLNKKQSNIISGIRAFGGRTGNLDIDKFNKYLDHPTQDEALEILDITGHPKTAREDFDNLANEYISFEDSFKKKVEEFDQQNEKPLDKNKEQKYGITDLRDGLTELMILQRAAYKDLLQHKEKLIRDWKSFYNRDDRKYVGTNYPVEMDLLGSMAATFGLPKEKNNNNSGAKRKMKLM